MDSVHRHPRRISTCPDAPSCPEVSAICGQQASLLIHLPTLRIGNITLRVHQALTTSRSAVKAARCEATRLLRQLADPCKFSRTGATACPDDHQCAPVSQLDHKLRGVRPHSKSGLPVHRDAVQHSTIHSGAPTEDASSPVRSSTLDDQPKHHSPWSPQITGHAGVHGYLHWYNREDSVFVRSSGRPPQHGARGPGAGPTGSQFLRGGLVSISSSPARSSPHHQGDGSYSLHGCFQFGLGSPVRLTLDTGTVVSISKIVAHQRSGDAGRHQCCERLPASSEVPGGLLDVWQRSDCGLHQERRRHTIVHTNADDDKTAQVVRSQGDHVGSRPSARSAQHPGRFAVQSRPDTEHWVDGGHGASTTCVCQVGRATGRLVCDIR